MGVVSICKLTVNPGIANFTWEKTGGIGASKSTTGNDLSASGIVQNMFLLNRVEFTGAAENNMQPGGPSQNLLGVEAVREFNVLRDNYGAEYGKRPGAQVTIVTQSGTNQFHGSAYEYLRDNALDAPNYFDVGSAPPSQRNQFGVSSGGPIVKNKSFFFANFEGFIQNLHQTSVAFVPDLASRAAAVPQRPASAEPLADADAQRSRFSTASLPSPAALADCPRVLQQRALRSELFCKGQFLPPPVVWSAFVPHVV